MSWYLGTKLKLEIYGQSHAPAIGVRAEGLPKGETVDRDRLDRFLQRRAPGNSPLSTARREPDRPDFLSGLEGDVLTGETLRAEIRNKDTRSKDYDRFLDVPRPGHADYTARVKYGGAMDMRGGGPFSGRLTAPLCIAGGIALQLLEKRGIRVDAHIRSIGSAEDRPFDPVGEGELEQLRTAEFPVLDAAAGEEMKRIILEARAQGDSVGGVIECMVTGLPAGLGGPLFEGLEGKLAAMVFAIPAVKGIEFGAGFEAARMRGSEHNDPYRIEHGAVTTATNHAGGILGGISDGMPLVFRAAFKPTPSIAREQQSVSLSRMEETTLTVGGRHDPCIVPRAVPVVEAAAALVLLDELL